MDAIEQFRAAMRAHELAPPEIIEPGKLHRFATNGKRHDDAGWCKLFADGGGGVFGDFRSGLSETWQAKREKPFTPAEREAFRQRCEAERGAHEAEEAHRHAEAREKAAVILEGATDDPAAHPYAIKKRVPLGPLVKRGPWPQRGWLDALLLPVYGGDGRLWSIEAINADGSKDSLKGASKRGGFHPLGKIRGAPRVLIAEGLANAAVGRAVDGSPGAAAMGKSNLLHAALAVRKLAPEAEIILLADNDLNVPREAQDAARAVGGRVAVPDLEGRKGDFWDLWHERGVEAVRPAIADAKAPGGDEPRPGNGAAPAGSAAPADDSASPEWPQTMAPDAYHGIAGEIVRAIEPHTESDPAGVLVQILTSFGLLIGRTAYYRVEGDRHYPNLFVLLNGGTSKGRKGTSWGRVRSIFERIPGWPRVVSGLSSGEGLKWQVRDPVYKLEKGVEVLVDKGVLDKRLLVIEPEFGSVTRVVARQGNTLSSTVRSAWDNGTLATLTKHDPITATDAHIAIIGHVTVDELRAELTQADTANGFANRFLFLCVRRSKCLSRGGMALPESVVQGFVSRLDRAARLAQNAGGMDMTDAGWGIWDRVYPDLSEGSPGLFGAATARAEAQVVRLAMLYALLDAKAQIDAPHLLAALALWEYAEASARHVFGSSLGDPVADEILRAVRAAGQEGMTRTQIRDLFKRNCSAARIGAALDLLARRCLVRRCTQETGGRPTEVWVSV